MWSSSTPNATWALDSSCVSSLQQARRRALTDNISLWLWHKWGLMPETHPGQQSEFPKTQWLGQNKAILHQLCHILSLKVKHISLLTWQPFLWQSAEMTFFSPKEEIKRTATPSFLHNAFVEDRRRTEGKTHLPCDSSNNNNIMWHL